MSRSDSRRKADDDKLSNAQRAAERAPRARTSVDALNERLRAQAFDLLDAEIVKLPAAQRPIFRLIQRLLTEKEQ